MISYFHHRKGKLNACEDSLTSTVFDTLKYLPTELFWHILKHSEYHFKLPKYPGEIESITYWDNWDSKNTANSKYVQPDVFIRFEEFDLIVEAKRYNENQQSVHQIENEIIAYENEYGNFSKKVYLLQVGGLQNKENELNIKKNNIEVIICKTDWTMILDSAMIIHNRLKLSDLSVNESYCRILEDTISGFALHGYFKKNWLKDINIEKPLAINSLNNIFLYVK